MACRIPVSRKTGCSRVSVCAEECRASDCIPGSTPFGAGSAFWVGRAGRLANDKFGANRHYIGESRLSTNPLQQDARRHFAHLSKRLANCCQTWNMEGRTLNIIEANHRNIGWNLQAMVPASTDSSDCRDVVVADNRSEFDAALNQFVRGLESQLRRRNSKLKLH